MPAKKEIIALGSAASILLAFLAWVIYTPIPFTLLKIAALGSIALLFLAVGFGFKYGKWVCLASLILLLALVCWPVPMPKASELRGDYLTALSSYRDTPYVWGGENARGIDCSGLVRRGMIDALLASGWKHKNLALWRQAVLVWWRDCSANEMKNGYGGRIVPLFAAKNLNAPATKPPHELKPGDLAVLKSGVHVLAFLGGRTWIQADPNLVNGGDKVVETTAPSRSRWFNQPVVICRWQCLN